MSWEHHLLGDFIEIKKGKSITKKESKEGPYPVILGGHEPAYFIDEYNHTGKAIVVSRSGASAGYVSFWNEPIFVTDGFLVEPSSEIDHDFLYFLMKSHENELQGLQGGSAIPHVTPRVINGISVVVPEINKQKRIASICRSFNSLIENNQKQIKLLEEAAQRLYKEWFIDLHFPGHETTPIADGIPTGWTVQSMNDIAEYINGYAFKPTDWGTVGKPIIKIKEMGSGVTADTPRNTGENIPEKYNVTAGDILFSWSATLSAMIWDEEDGLLNQHLFKVIPGEGISREFVLQSILKTLDEFSNLTTGSTMKHIQRGKLKEVKVNVPSDELMMLYKNISEPIREQILNVKRQMILLREARDRLLPKLMNGEIEV